MWNKLFLIEQGIKSGSTTQMLFTARYRMLRTDTVFTELPKHTGWLRDY